MIRKIVDKLFAEDLIGALPGSSNDFIELGRNCKLWNTVKSLDQHRESEVIDLTSDSEEHNKPKEAFSNADENPFQASGQSASKTLPDTSRREQKFSPRRGKEIKRCILPNRDHVGTLDTVELKRKSGQPQEFLLVHYVSKETTANDTTFWLTGLKLRRNADSQGQLPHGNSGATEVFIMFRHDQNKRRSAEGQSLETVNADQAVRKRSCIQTNQLYPATEYASEDMRCSAPLSQDVLVCRWKHTLAYRGMEVKPNSPRAECCFQRLDQNTPDSGYAVPDVEIWRASAKGSSAGRLASSSAGHVSEISKITLEEETWTMS